MSATPRPSLLRSAAVVVLHDAGEPAHGARPDLLPQPRAGGRRGGGRLRGGLPPAQPAAPIHGRRHHDRGLPPDPGGSRGRRGRGGREGRGRPFPGHPAGPPAARRGAGAAPHGTPGGPAHPGTPRGPGRAHGEAGPHHVPLPGPGQPHGGLHGPAEPAPPLRPGRLGLGLLEPGLHRLRLDHLEGDGARRPRSPRDRGRRLRLRGAGRRGGAAGGGAPRHPPARASASPSGCTCGIRGCSRP